MSHYKHTSFSVVAVVVALFFGLYLGKTSATINPTKEILEIISCNGYEEEFLKNIGYENRDQCKSLNTSLYQQYLGQCLKDIKTLNDEKNYKRLVNFCVYHLFSKNYLQLSSEYFSWRSGK